MCFLPASASAAGGTPDGFFGVNPGDLFKLPQAKWDANLQAIADDGVQVVRMGAWWSDLEPGPPVNGHHNYSWSDVDKQVVALARHGLQWEPLLCFSATWGAKVDGDYSAAPRGEENFSLFAAALAKRYGPDGSFWTEHPELPKLPVSAYEIWNEENAKVYWHPSTPEDYADLYAASRSAIKSVDPRARVVLGGLAASNGGSTIAPEDFLRAMYAHRPDLKGNVDAVGFHPYAQDPQSVYAKIAEFRQELDDIAGAGRAAGAHGDRLDHRRRVGEPARRVHARRHLDAGAHGLRRRSCLGVLVARAREGCGRSRAVVWHRSRRWLQQADGRRVRGRGQEGSRGRRRHRSHLRQQRLVARHPPALGPQEGHEPAKLKLRVKVRRHSRKSGRLIVKTRCSKGCLVRVEMRSASRQGTAAATRLKTFSTKASSRNRTFRIKYARGTAACA